MTDLHLLFPAGYDDPRQSSGGNRYDREVVAGLGGLGWSMVRHDVPGGWPEPDAGVGEAVESRLATIPDGGIVLVDGLLGTAGAGALVRHSPRLRLIVLVHMPGPPGGPPAEVLRVVRLVITTSEWTARTLVAEHGLPPDLVVAAAPGVEAGEVVTGTPSGGSLLCVAAVTAAKGHDTLFAALARLADRRWTLVCAGALDRDEGFVRRQRAALAADGLTGRVRLAGSLTGVDLESVYAAADLVVLPTRSDSYGLVVTEALAHGLPVVATRVGGVPEALGHAPDGRRPGLLVAAGEVDDLAAALARWLDDRSLREALRSAARARRLRLDGWDRTVTTVAAAVRSLDR